MEGYINSENLDRKTATWLNKVEPYNKHKLVINNPGAALIVVDMQNFFLNPDSPTFTPGGPAIMQNVNKLIKLFRKLNRPVIYTCHVHHPDMLDAGIMEWWWPGMCLEGSEESQVHEEISPLPHEKIIYKHRYSAFYNTDLETILRCLKIEDLVITGIMTNMCCESTARDAYYRDYRVFFPADATGSINEELHVATLMNLAFGFAHITSVKNIALDLSA